MEAAIAAILSAIITGIIGPLLALGITKRNEISNLPKVSNKRLTALKGKWYGFFDQSYEGEKRRFDGMIFFQVSSNRVVGEAEYTGLQGKTKLTLYNGIFDGNVLKIEYRNATGYIVQYGTAIMEMNARGDLCEGLFIGFSPESENIISGTVSFSASSEE